MTGLSATRKSETQEGEWKATVAFLAASVFRKFGNAIWIPFLLLCVPPAEFTRFGMLISAVNLMVPALSCGVMFAPSRIAFDYSTRDDRFTLFRTVLGPSVLLPVVGLSLVFLMTQLMTGDLLTNDSNVFRICIGLHVIAAILGEFAFSFLRVHGQAKRFAVTAGIYAFVPFFLAVPILFLSNLDSVLVISFCTALGLLVATFCALSGDVAEILSKTPRRDMLRSSLQYSVPISLHLIGLWGINASGRWIGTISQSLEQMASFTLFSAVASLLMGFPRAMYEARMPACNTAFGAGEVNKAIAIIQRCTTISIFAVLAFYLLAFLTIEFGERWIPDDYVPGMVSLACFCLFNVAHCAYTRGVNILAGLKRTSRLAIATLVSGSFSVAVSYIACNRLGQVGLAGGMAAGMLIQSIFVNTFAFVLSRQHGCPSNAA